MRSLNEILEKTTKDYIAQLNLDDLPSQAEIEAELVGLCRSEIVNENQILAKGEKYPIPKALNTTQIAELLLFTKRIVKIAGTENCLDTEHHMLAIYQEFGKNEGLYVSDIYALKREAKKYCYSITNNEMKDVIEKLYTDAETVQRTMDRDLIAVNNGIFNYATKQLEPFSPEYVYLSKSRVDYNPFVQNPIIHNDDDGTDWDVESWMTDLFEDPELTQLSWEILSAIVRPFVRWCKSAWFYSNTGSNGKGCLCELMRQLCGEGSYASLSLSDLSKEFFLEPLLHANAIIRDENDVGTYIDKAANIKAIITNDVVLINRKNIMPISFQFYGFMVQCLNEFPRIKDKSDSFYRRQLFVPFNKCFTGKERKYIKEDYLHRTEVLEYVLFKVLHDMNFYTFSEPQACKAVLDEYKEFNDPVRQFLDEMLPQFVWDLLPFKFLYEMFKEWSKRNNPSGTIQGKSSFIAEVVNIIKDNDEWSCENPKKYIRIGKKMDKTELLISEYELKNWRNSKYMGIDINKVCSPELASAYTGILRNSCNGDD